MTSGFDRALPPLTGLPSPARAPEENPALVAPAEILVDSRRALTRRMLRIAWVPALVLMALWYVLVFLYVTGASPTFWLLSLLVGLFDPHYLRMALGSLGFTSRGLWITALFLPVTATAVSVALLPLASVVISGINPRHHLSEAGFQRAVATRITAVLMAPVLVVVAILMVLVAQPFGRVPLLHWPSLSPGPLTSLCAGLLAIMVAWISIRSWMSAPRVLGITPAGALETTARLDRDHDARRRAAKQVLAQDRRHLPPNPGTDEAAGARTPRGMVTSLLVQTGAWLRWVAPALLGLGVMIFGIADVVAVFTGMGQDLQAVQSAPLNWPTVLGAVLVAAVVAVAAAVAPALAEVLSRSQRAQVSDQRAYPAWEHRARVNPWEARVVGLSGWIVAAAALAAIAFTALLLALLGASTGLSWTWVVLGGLVAVPLLGLGSASALRSGLRAVYYGPAHRTMRRETPHALIAPDIGTRADRARDPAVRAHLRQRLQADGQDHALEIFDLDAAGERLWIDESLPGARTTEVRAADVTAGRLPDFGGDASPFRAQPEPGERRGPGGRARDGHGSSGHGGSGHGGSGHGGSGHDIPDSITGLREP